MLDNGESSGRTWPQTIGLFAGPLAAAWFAFAPALGRPLDAEHPELNAMAAVLALMAIWWLTEALPMAVTALVPLVLYPLLKIPPGSNISQTYGHPLIFLFLGGFLIALAIEDSGLHRRVALLIISAVGDNPRRVILGFMLATAGLSMWISNTATTIMLLPIAANVLVQVERNASDPRKARHFGVALMLGLAYSASIGGVGTLIGTPPNVQFKAFYEKYYPGNQISFAGWMAIAVPYAVCFLFVAWLFLTRVVFRLPADSALGGRDVIRRQLRELGAMQPAEWRMLFIFLTTAILWITREPVQGQGWATWFGTETIDGFRHIDDGTVAIFMAILCFIVPSGKGDGTRLLDWRQTTRLPWGILLLFGGGLALGTGMQNSGLDVFLGRQLAGVMGGFSELGMMFVTATGMTFLTELTSNMASINMLLPILRGTCDELGMEPRLLMITATLASSCAFMLPVATAPNAIVYGSGRLRMADMIKAGFGLNLIGVVLIVVFLRLLG